MPRARAAADGRRGRGRRAARVRRHVHRRADGAAGQAGGPGRRRPGTAATAPSWAASASRRRCWGWSRRSPRAAPATCWSTRSRSSRRWCWSQAANAGMVGHHAHRLHARDPPPDPARRRAAAPPLHDALDRDLDLHACSRACCCCPLDIELLAGMFAYGALIAFALAHLSVCVMRFKEPDRARPSGCRSTSACGGASCRCRPRSARCCRSSPGSGSALPRRGAAARHGLDGARARLLRDLPRRARACRSPARSRSRPTRAVAEPEVEYGSILVPVFGEELDDDIMSTAGQLATDEGAERARAR